MTETTGVQLVRNDGSLTFNLKCQQVEVNLGNNVVSRALLSAAGDVAGADPVLNNESYRLIGVTLAEVDSSDYPSDDGDWGNTFQTIPWKTKDAVGNIQTIPASEDEQRMEAALRHAAKEWGPDVEDGFDQLVWNDQHLDVIITSYGATESAEQPKPGVYQVDIEVTHVDVYVG